VYSASSESDPVILQDPSTGPTFSDFYLEDQFDRQDKGFDMLGTQFGRNSDAMGGDLCCKNDDNEVRWNSVAG